MREQEIITQSVFLLLSGLMSTPFLFNYFGYHDDQPIQDLFVHVSSLILAFVLSVINFARLRVYNQKFLFVFFAWSGLTIFGTVYWSFFGQSMASIHTCENFEGFCLDSDQLECEAQTDFDEYDSVLYLVAHINILMFSVTDIQVWGIANAVGDFEIIKRVQEHNRMEMTRFVTKDMSVLMKQEQQKFQQEESKQISPDISVESVTNQIIKHQNTLEIRVLDELIDQKPGIGQLPTFGPKKTIRKKKQYLNI